MVKLSRPTKAYELYYVVWLKWTQPFGDMCPMWDVYTTISPALPWEYLRLKLPHQPLLLPSQEVELAVFFMQDHICCCQKVWKGARSSSSRQLTSTGILPLSLNLINVRDYPTKAFCSWLNPVNSLPPHWILSHWEDHQSHRDETDSIIQNETSSHLPCLPTQFSNCFIMWAVSNH